MIHESPPTSFMDAMTKPALSPLARKRKRRVVEDWVQSKILQFSLHLTTREGDSNRFLLPIHPFRCCFFLSQTQT